MSDFTFFVADISGGGVPGYTGSLSADVNFNNQDVSGVATITEIDNGYYVLSAELGVGNGYASVIAAEATRLVSPDFYQIDLEATRTNDEIYNLVNIQTLNPTLVDRSATFGQYEITTKENDTFNQQMTVPNFYIPLTGWTNFTVKIYDESRRTDGSVAPLGTGVVNVIDEATGLLSVVISDTVMSTAVIPSGVSNAILLADVQATDSNGFSVTVISLEITITRDYNPQ